MEITNNLFCQCVFVYRYTGREYTAESYLASHGIGPVTGYGVSILLFYIKFLIFVQIRLMEKFDCILK